MINYDTYQLTGKKRVYFYLIVGLLMAGVGFLFYKSKLIIILFIALSYPIEKYYVKQLAQKMRRELSYQFRDLLYSLSASFATGRHMQEALIEAESGLKLIYDEKAAINRELAHMVKRMIESKESEEELLWDFAIRSNVEDIRNFVDIYSICKRTGGNMEKVIMRAIDVLLDKIDIKREINTLTAQKRMESYILTAIPFILLIFLHIVSPNYLAVMYETIEGRIIMTLALLTIVTSLFWNLKLTNISI
ncbi:MAG: hypothetical protein GX363_01255 [Clostridiales bacterium]|jgi:tight adherence protein B|nr:hypothetical protein [Clostridiales bacterium]